MTGTGSRELIDDFAIAGSVARRLEPVEELGALGVGGISSACRNAEFDQIKRIGADIVPTLRDSSAAARAG